MLFRRILLKIIIYDYQGPDKFLIEKKGFLFHYLFLTRTDPFVFGDKSMIRTCKVFLKENKNILEQPLSDEGVYKNSEYFSDFNKSSDFYKMWLGELNYLFRTLDSANKPRIIELLVLT